MGEKIGEYFGSTIELSNDGSLLAVGSLGKDGVTTGSTRIYKNINSVWTQIGQQIDSDPNYRNYDRYNSVQLSGDGSILAVGFQYDVKDDVLPRGVVKLYENKNNQWVQIGKDINGDLEGDFFGSSLSLSLDGSTLAAGSHLQFETPNLLHSRNAYINIYGLSSFKVSDFNNGSALFFIDGTADIGKKLTASKNSADPDGDGSFTYKWESSSDNSTWDLVGSLSKYKVGSDDEGKDIRLNISYTDAQGFEESVTTEKISVPSFNSGAAEFSITGTLEVGKTLSIEENSEDPDGTGEISYSWAISKDGLIWSQVGTDETYKITASEEGKKIRATISYTDSDGFLESVITDISDIAYTDEGDAIFEIEGEIAIGETIAITESSEDPDDGTGELSYSWETSTDEISWLQVSTESAYEITKTDEGKKIKAILSYKDGKGFSEEINTETTNIPYVNDGAADFNIEGNIAFGQALSIKELIADPDTTGSLAYKWQKSDDDGLTFKNISTKSTYKISTEDELASIKCVISYEDSQGFSEEVSTETINVPAFNDGKAILSINGKAIVGEILSIRNLDADPDGGTGEISYQWQTSSTGISWNNVGTNSTYTFKSEDEGKNVRAVLSYTDGQGFDEKLYVEPDPYQKVVTNKQEISFSPGNNTSFDLIYTTSDNQNALPGLGLKVHYDSTIFTPSGENNGVSALVDTFGDPTIIDDTDDFDNDTTTDKYLAITWADFTGNFPGEDLPAKLASLSFSTSKEGVDSLTGENKELKINLTSLSPAENYDFLGDSVTLKPLEFNLDVDGNGKVSALGDGLMVIRKLFGAAFEGNKLTDKAMSNDATRTTQEIHDFIQAGMDEKILDVDGDGSVTALGDGLMVIRKLFGAAFSGDALTSKALSNNATRTTDEIHDYIAVMSDIGSAV